MRFNSKSFERCFTLKKSILIEQWNRTESKNKSMNIVGIRCYDRDGHFKRDGKDELVKTGVANTALGYACLYKIKNLHPHLTKQDIQMRLM